VHVDERGVVRRAAGLRERGGSPSGRAYSTSSWTTSDAPSFRLLPAAEVDRACRGRARAEQPGREQQREHEVARDREHGEPEGLPPTQNAKKQRNALAFPIAVSATIGGSMRGWRASHAYARRRAQRTSRGGVV
jgi:hypothetical protein